MCVRPAQPHSQLCCGLELVGGTQQAAAELPRKQGHTAGGGWGLRETARAWYCLQMTSQLGVCISLARWLSRQRFKKNKGRQLGQKKNSIAQHTGSTQVPKEAQPAPS